MLISNQKELGKWGEDLACSKLEELGYKILTRNFRFHHFCEIDIIAQKENMLCFIEVKTRYSQHYGTPAEAVTKTKQQRIHRCAEYFLMLNNLLARQPMLSFDVIEIIGNGEKVRRFHFYHSCF